MSSAVTRCNHAGATAIAPVFTAFSISGDCLPASRRPTWSQRNGDAQKRRALAARMSLAIGHCVWHEVELSRDNIGFTVTERFVHAEYIREVVDRHHFAG